LNEFNSLNGSPLFFQSICDRLRRSSVDPNLLVSVWQSVSELARIGAKHGSSSPSMKDLIDDWFRPKTLEDELELVLSNVNHRLIVAKQVTVCNSLNLLRMLQLFCELHNEQMRRVYCFFSMPVPKVTTLWLQLLILYAVVRTVSALYQCQLAAKDSRP